MATNLQLVEQPEKPERCAAENLKPGQFLAAGALTTGRPTEVLFVDTYPSDGGGRETLLVHRPLGVDWSLSTTVGGNHWFDLATEQDLADFRAGAERANRIADIRALADWLEANPDVPLAPYPSEQVDLHDGAASVAFVRELAAKFDGKVREDLDDRTQVYIKFGSFEYRVIAWHYEGRPADPEPEAFVDQMHQLADQVRAARTEDDPSGLSYSRSDDEATADAFLAQAAGRRVEPHTGGVTEGGLVDESVPYCPRCTGLHDPSEHDAERD